MTSYAALHRDLLTGGNASGLLGVDCVFLLPDRTLSPAGDRRLKELRAPSPAQGGWPNPGVYSIPEFAERLLAEFELAQQRRGLRRPLLSALEAVVAISATTSDGEAVDEPHVIHQRLRRTRELHKLGLSPATWSELLREYEEDSSPELKSTTQDVIFHLRALATTHEHGWLSPWQAVGDALAQLAASALSAQAWIRATERPPGAARLRFVVPAYRELFPSETEFLQVLAKHHEVIYLRPEVSGEAPLSVEGWPRAFPRGRGSEALLWSFRLRRPTALEVLELLPGDFSVDVPEPPAPRSLREARALQLWAQYAAEGRPDQHPFLYGDRARTWLVSEGFDPESEPTLAQLCAWLIRRAPSEARSLTVISERSCSPLMLRSWVRLFAELEIFASEDAESVALAPHPRQSPRGLPVYSLEDLPILGVEQVYFWSSPEELASLTDPAAAETLALRLFPSQFLDLLERRGISVPDPSREATLLAALLKEREREFPESLIRLEAPAEMLVPAPHAKAFHLQGDVRPNSVLRPTGLEAYLRCPMQYYLGQVLRLDQDEEWDPETPSPMSRGSWIHKVLETALDPSTVGVRNETWFRETLVTTLPEFFPHATPAYRKLIEEDARLSATRLALHFARFELPLQQAFPQRELRREEKIDGLALGAHFSGRIDRHDILPKGRALVWDYKTGRTTQSRPDALVRNGRLQWFLYRELLGLDTLSCGGGYLNPLEPGDSRLLFPRESFPELQDFFLRVEEAGYPITWLTPKGEETVTAEFTRSVAPALAALQRAEFPAEPSRPIECTRCDHRGLCARPYLAEESAE